MLDSFKAMGALAGLLKNQDALRIAGERVRDKLARTTVQGEAGGGAVRVTMTGQMKVQHVEMDPALGAGLAGDEQSRSMAEALLAEAMTAALERAQNAAREAIMAEAEAMGLGDLAGSLGNLLP